MYYGVDTSFWQGNYTPPGDRSFNIINASRANNGGFGVGSYYVSQVRNARAAGKEVGHYFFNGNYDPTWCADRFVDNLYDFRKGQDVIVLDCESEGSTGTRAWGPAEAAAWVGRVCARLGIPASTIGIYLNRSLMNGSDWSTLVAWGTWLWIAYPGATPGLISYWPDWTMWQWTVSGGIDQNQSKRSLREIAGGSGPTPVKKDVVEQGHWEHRPSTPRPMEPGVRLRMFKQGTSAGQNIARGSGAAYSFTTHFYGTGFAEGDTVDLWLVWSNPGNKPEESTHYLETYIADSKGEIHASTEFKRRVIAKDSVFVDVRAGAANKQTGALVLLDADTFHFSS